MKDFLERLKPVWRPHAGQAEFLLNRAKTKILACGRRWGKTEACAVEVLKALCERNPIRYLLVAPTLDQARILFDRALSLIQRTIDAGITLGDSIGQSLQRLRFSPYPQFAFGEHFVSARSGHLSRSLRGNEATHVIVDEAAYVPEELITEVVMPMLATSDGCLSLISTPNGRNHFYRFFQLGKANSEACWSRSAPSRENPLVSARFLQVQKELSSERAFAVEYEAEFLDSNGQVFRSESVRNCLVTELPNVLGETFIGIDWGRYQDYTTLAALRGTRERSVLLECVRLPQTAWETQLSKIASILEKYPPSSVTVDGSGYGDVLIDRLRSVASRHTIRTFEFTSPSKTELINNLATLIEQERLYMLPNPPLLRELEAFQFTQTKFGNTKFEARAGCHDDLVIALALAARDLPRGSGIVIASGGPRRFDLTPEETSMFKLFSKRQGREEARQLSIYQRQSFAYPSPAPGALPNSTLDAMERDSMVQTALTVKKLGVLAADWTIEGSDVAITSFVRDSFERMEGSPLDVLRQAMDAFAKGWSIQELIFSEGRGRLWLEAVHPKDPALFGMDVDSFGNIERLRLAVPGEEEQILPRAKFVLWANRGGYGRPKGRSDLESAYPHWSAKQTLLAAWKLHLERFAMPTVMGRFEPGLSIEDRQALIRALDGLQNNSSLVFPSDVEISTLDVAKQASAGFMDALDFHNREIARCILGQTLTTDEGRRVGSLAMGKVHLQVLLLQLQALRTELADTVITEQVIRTLVELNFGKGAPVPRFRFEEAKLEAFTTGAV